jgi:hypothetical protein
MVMHVAMHVEVHVKVPALYLSLYFRSYQFKLPACNSTESTILKVEEILSDTRYSLIEK